MTGRSIVHYIKPHAVIIKGPRRIVDSRKCREAPSATPSFTVEISSGDNSSPHDFSGHRWNYWISSPFLDAP